MRFTLTRLPVGKVVPTAQVAGMTSLRLLFAVLAVAVMAVLSAGVAIHAGQWGWWSALYLVSLAHDALFELGFYPSPGQFPSWPDPWDALRWTLCSVGAIATACFALHALRPIKSIVRGGVGGKKGPDIERLIAYPFNRVVQELREVGGVKIPVSLWVIKTQTPIAFAVGSPGRAAIAISAGLANGLSGNQVRWVLAHEMAHIRYRDSLPTAFWLSSMRAVMKLSRAQNAAARMIVTAMIAMRFRAWMAAPVIFALNVLNRWASIVIRVGRWVYLVGDRFMVRHIEYRADAWASELEGPAAGISVLTALQGDAEPTWGGLMATHPPLNSRVERLQESVRLRSGCVVGDAKP